MATEVKIIRESGIEGRIVHRHDGGAWHPAHRSHSGARGPEANAHVDHAASEPVNLKAVLKTADQRKAYANALKGIEQPEFAAVWEARKAKLRGKSKTAATPSKAQAIADGLDEYAAGEVKAQA